MMNSKTFRAAALDACMKLHGEAFNEEVFKSALGKCKRHMRSKYGALDYEEEYAEGGVDNVVFFYEESAKGTKRTWNGANGAKPVVGIVPTPKPAAAKPAAVVEARPIVTALDALAVLADDNATPEAIEAALATLA